MSEQDKKTGGGLPSIEKGVGGAGRVQGLLTEAKAEDTKGTLLRFLKTLKPFRVTFVLAIALTLLGTLSQVIAPRLVGNIITDISSTISQRIPIPWESILRTVIILGYCI
ncbi:MAG: hypothetical protein PHV73_03740 [Eubacteriales bacterium]|nr:hypothetical protein [Eubacteriales bacterium]